MAKKNKSAARATTPKFIPLNPLGENKLGVTPTKKKIMRLLGVLAALFVIAFFILASGGGGTSLHIYWSLIAPILLVIPALLLCAIGMIYLRCIARTTWTRLGLTIAMVLVICVVAAIGITITYMGYSYGEIPVAYGTSPDGERIVIMRSVNPDIDPNSLGGYTLQYSGYEMVNSQFYLYYSFAPGTAIYSDTELEPAWGIEWLDDGDARLYLTDYAGYPHSETRIIIYDMANLEASLDAKAHHLSATPVPGTIDIDSLPEPTPTPAADPFSY